MAGNSVVRTAEPDDTARCVAIVEGLPDHFTPDVPEHVARDLARNRGWVVVDGDEVVAFAVVSTRFAGAAEILWAAVDHRHRGRGLGTTMIVHLLAELEREGVRLVEVKTLDPSAAYEPYVATYGFWTARGFVQIDTVDPPGEWDQSNPAAILVAPLR